MPQSSDQVNILIVDDKVDKLLSLEAVLADLGQNIVRAYSGREALRCLLTQEFAVILLDVNMPGMDGFETAELIRERKSCEHTPIIFITAYGDEIFISRGYSLRAVDYILTPVVPEVLRSKVSVFVDLYRKNRQITQQAERLRHRAVQLQKLAHASLAINSAISVERMLQSVTESARDIVGAHQAITLSTLDRATGGQLARTEAHASFSEKYAEWEGRRLDLDACASTIVARSAISTRLTHAQLLRHPDWRVVKGLDVPPIRGVLAAPLTGRDGRRLGLIYLTDKHDDADFTEDDEAILVQLAQTASVAIENTIYAEAREANRLKDEFLATLSHELRTPLNAMLGWTRLLRMEKLTPQEASHGLEVIERNVRAQAKLIEDLLDVSRITAGKIRLNARRIELGPLLKAVTDSARPTAEARGVKLSLTCDEGGELTCDPDRLQQVFWNLLSNALKFTPSGGSVTIASRLASGRFHVSVADTGRGISPEFIPHVFDRFRQGDASTVRSHGGLGIGLTIVRHIVDLHGGSVHAESAGDGKGSTFTVVLPASPPAVAIPSIEAPDQREAAGAPVNGKAHPAKPRADLRGLRILVVDDEPDARELIAEVLRRHNANVRTAGSAASALEAMDEDPSELLVSDIAMPQADGYWLMQAIRARTADRGGQAPAIALTAYARDEDRQRAQQAGFQLHLAKPVDPEELIAAVQQLAATGPEQGRESRIALSNQA